MNALKNALLAFFEEEASEARYVINKVKKTSLDSRLTDSSRTILELINHIAQIPRIDVGIYSGEFDSGELAHQMELKLNKETVDDVIGVLDEGILYVKEYFKDISDDDLQERKLRPFYEEDTPLESWAHFLPKFVAHIALHKGILWAYLKVAKTDVNMFTYYGH